ncbi:MAG: hypothetical protein IKE36_08525 [Solobacterium sp.]|nr:hypothetical protein [Solobacterium sp.]
MTHELLEECRWIVAEEVPDEYLEFHALMLVTAKYLLSADRAIIHGVSFIWKEKAWIITAPSGTGKTTQYRNWRSLLGKGIQVINGDKSVLSFSDDGRVFVSSSPWQGKERYGRPGFSAELGGIILLEKGDHNEIRQLTAKEAVRSLFVEFISIPDTPEQIRILGNILERILDRTPVWKLTNLGDLDSAKLTKDTLSAYLEVQHG